MTNTTNTTEQRTVDRVCKQCGAPFQRTVAILRTAGGQFCTPTCESVYLHNASPEKRAQLLAEQRQERGSLPRKPAISREEAAGLLALFALMSPPAGPIGMRDGYTVFQRQGTAGAEQHQDPVEKRESVLDRKQADVLRQHPGKVDDGGPAFPTSRVSTDSGMTLRAHFAGLAMQTYIAGLQDPMGGPGEPVEYASAIARDSVAMADALIAALKGGAQ